MKLKAEMCAISYCVPIPDQQAFLRLIRKEDDLKEVDGIWKSGTEDFDAELERLGADNIEYNGHFGANIFFSLGEADFENLDKIVETIEAFVI